MRPRRMLGLLFLLIVLATFGCAGMDTHQSSGGYGPALMDCNGDIPMNYPPYCRPSH